ncbi:MAG TPA: hypothetical protein VFS20_14850 [Longimicrobium sp.]|nr:hypothetical protein [Longimicrobium sp.]
MTAVRAGPERDAHTPGPGAPDEPVLLTEIATLDQVLHAHAAALGGDFTAYRNHAYRVANLCVALSSPAPAQVEKIALAAAFHDLGIWTDGTFDYLPPSIRLAEAWLARAGHAEWTAEITAMISEHHGLRRRERSGWLVEPFRKADWVDVTRGVLRFGVPRSLVRELHARWPDAGFHRRLVHLSLRRLRTHPLNPLPMFRW